MAPFCTVYYADVAPLASSALFERGLALLPGERQEKVRRLIPPAGKRLSLGAGLLLRRALGDAGLDLLDVRLAAGPAGKPFLPDHPELCFNLSHAGSRAACVLSTLPCGVDVEVPGRGSEQLVRRFYAEEEQGWIAACPGEFQHRFTRIWTRKESCLKATGEGFTRSPESFSVLSLPPEVRFFDGPEEEDHLYSLCLLAPEDCPVPVWRKIDLEAEIGG